jgi:hypothetical protein
MPLTYRDRGTSNTQLDIMSGSVAIGRLGKDKFAVGVGDLESWSWTFCFDAGPPGYRRHGHAADLESSMEEIERVWQQWLDAAGLREGS